MFVDYKVDSVLVLGHQRINISIARRRARGTLRTLVSSLATVIYSIENMANLHSYISGVKLSKVRPNCPSFV